MVKKRLSYSEEVQTGSGQKTTIYTNLPQEYVEELQKTTTGQAKYDWYHGHRKGVSQTISVTQTIMTHRIYLSNITPAPGYGRNVIHKIM